MSRRICCVPGCQARTGPNTFLLSLPKLRIGADEEERRQTEKLLEEYYIRIPTIRGRKAENVKICTRHFDSASLDVGCGRTSAPIRRNGALPSLFLLDNATKHWGRSSEGGQGETTSDPGSSEAAVLGLPAPLSVPVDSPQDISSASSSHQEP